MIGNFDDQMARLAFGEISDADKERMREEAERNPVLAARLREYETMRYELTRMREVPSDQLSKERLREAILNRAIRPEPKRNFLLGYSSLVGFAFCAAAAMVYVGRFNSKSEPTVVLPPATTRPTEVAFQEPGTRKWSAPVDVPREAKLDEAKSAKTRGQDSGYRLATRRVPRIKREMVPIDVEPTDLTGPSKATPKQYQAKLQPAAEPESVPSIVLIDQGKGGPGDAGKATEVGSPNDVLIGG